MKRNKMLYPAALPLLLMLTAAVPLWRLTAEIKVEAKDMQTDRLGNVYAISNTNQLYKFDAAGKQLSTLNYAYLGNITHLDAGNPLELYLFYREMNAVVFLDNNLAYRGRTNLSDAGIVQASAVGRSYSNGIWVFDQADLQLKKLNKDGTPVQASGNVMQFCDNLPLNPSHILDNGNRVFVTDSTVGILVFDVFANYLKTIPVKGCEEICSLGDEIYYARNGRIISYHLQTMHRDTLPLPLTEFSQFAVEKERLYLNSQGKISIYSSR